LDFKNVLKLVGTGIGAGVTGGYLALRLRRPKQSYDDFLKLYDTLSVDFVSQLEGCFLQTLLPAVAESERGELEELLDHQANFLEKMRFFQRHLSDFDSLTVKSLERFYAVRQEGFIALLARKRLSGHDKQAIQIAVGELFVTLETAFSEAMVVNVPEEDREEFDIQRDETLSLIERLSAYKERYPNLGSVLFDALSLFEGYIVDLGRR
jgi:hypothetical protein